MNLLRAAVGFGLRLADRLEVVRAPKIALPWEEKEASAWARDKTSKEKRLLCHLARRDPFGKVIAEVKQVGGRIEWTATGMTAQIMEGINLGPVRTAPTLVSAILSVDSYLEGNNWEIQGKMVFPPAEESDET